MEIKILGSGCANCKKLYALTESALKDTGVSATLEKVEDMAAIMSYGVMRTPAIVINGTVKAYGRIPGKEELQGFIRESV